jgi:peptidoglycan/LPS O-acetylase OafA/YrhL
VERSRSRISRIDGLDGVRALAVIAVVVYHLWPTVLPGGFVGVDVFFVLSGYLITRSFTRVAGARAGARLGTFWHHRARRILPPLLLVIAVTATVAGLIGRNVLPGLWAAVLGAVTFSSNWVAIVQARSYFADTTAHPLQHLWSLAVEEQFYLLWPLFLLLLALLPLRIRFWTPVVVAALSASAMAVLYQPGSDPTAVYVGTGTHLFGLALGAAVALREQRRGLRAAATMRRRVIAALAGAAAVVFLLGAACWLDDTATITYRGGLLSVSVAAMVLIRSLTAGVPGIGRLLDLPPLRTLGRRSYAVYLWHWPALILLTAVITPHDDADQLLVRILTLVITAAAAELSFRWIEAPILTNGWRATARSVWNNRAFTRVAVATGTGLLVIGTATASIASTRPSDAEQLITASQRYLHDHTTSPTPRPTPAPAPSTPAAAGTPPSSTPAAVPSATLSPTGTQANPATSSPASTTTPGSDVSGQPITAVGDSVMLAAAPTLQAALPNMSINAKVSRQPADVAPILRGDAAAGTLANVVVVGIGTNGALGTTLPRIRSTIGPDRTLLLVTAHGNRAWIPDVDATIRAYAAASPNTRIVEWNRSITGHDDLLAADGIHPGTAGARIYANALLTALRS